MVNINVQFQILHINIDRLEAALVLLGIFLSAKVLLRVRIVRKTEILFYVFACCGIVHDG